MTARKLSMIFGPLLFQDATKELNAVTLTRFLLERPDALRQLSTTAAKITVDCIFSAGVPVASATATTTATATSAVPKRMLLMKSSLMKSSLMKTTTTPRKPVRGGLVRIEEDDAHLMGLPSLTPLIQLRSSSGGSGPGGSDGPGGVDRRHRHAHNTADAHASSSASSYSSSDDDNSAAAAPFNHKHNNHNNQHNHHDDDDDNDEEDDTIVYPGVATRTHRVPSKGAKWFASIRRSSIAALSPLASRFMNADGIQQVDE